MKTVQHLVGLLLVCIVTVAMSSSPAKADSHQWIDTAGTWSASSNWSPQQVPVSGDSANVSQGVAHIADDNAWVDALYVDGNGTVVVGDWMLRVGATGSDGVLQVGVAGTHGTFVQTGGSVYVHGDANLVVGVLEGSDGL